VASRSALLIATYDYHDTGLRRLTAPAHDAEALAEVLRSPDIAGFEVTTLINEPHYRVGEAIADLYRDRRQDDLTLLYFTGHGLKDEDGRLYLATTNTRRDSLLFSSLPAEQVDQAMSASRSRRNVLILDCCYSGAFPAGALPKADSAVQTLERFQGRGRAVLTASDSTQYSFEGNRMHGSAPQSVFTRHLVAGLRDGSADLDYDGDITIDELYNYVYDRVTDEMPQQRPKKLDSVEGRLVLARNVSWSPSAAERGAGQAAVGPAAGPVAPAQPPTLAAALAALPAQLTAWSGKQARRARQVPPASPLALAAAGFLVAALAWPAAYAAVRGALAWYVGTLAVVALAVGAALLHPRTKAAAGPGAVIGAGAGCVWGLVLFAQLFYEPDGTKAFWVAVAGHALLLAAACTAGLALYRDGAVKFAPRWPGNRLTWVLAAVAGVSAVVAALALTGELYRAARLDEVRHDFRLSAAAWSYLAAAVLALAVPAAAAVLLPRRLGRWLVGGWAAACTGIWLTTVLPGGGIVGLGTGYLAAPAPVVPAVLAAATAALWRWGGVTTSAPSGRRPDRVAVAAVLVLPLLAAAGAGAALLAAHRTVLETLAFGAPVVSADGHLLYAPVVIHSSKHQAGYEHDPGRLVVVDATTSRPAGPPVALGSGSYEAVASHDGTRVYVSNTGSGSVSMISTLERAVVGTPIAIGHTPVHLAVSTDGSRLLVTDRDQGVSVIDTRTGTVTRRVTLPANTQEVTLNPDGSRAYACGGDKCDLRAIDTTTGRTVGGPVRLGYQPESMAVSGDGSRLYAAFFASGEASDMLVAVDTRTLKAVGGHAPLGSGPHFNLAVGPDGRRVYVGNYLDESVSVIDAQAMRLVGTPVPVGGLPEGVAVSPDGRRVYVTVALKPTIAAIATFPADSPDTVSLISLVG
jgi:YVTN family beta-propeller protein